MSNQTFAGSELLNDSLWGADLEKTLKIFSHIDQAHPEEEFLTQHLWAFSGDRNALQEGMSLETFLNNSWLNKI